MVSLHRNPTNQKQTLTTMNCGFKTVKSGSLFPNQNRKLGGEDEKENLSSDDPTGSLDGMGIGMGDFSDVLYTSTPKQQQQQQQQHHPQMQFPQFPKSTAGEDEMQQDRDGEGSFAEFDGGIEDSFEDIQDEEAGVDIMRVMVDEETTMGY